MKRLGPKIPPGVARGIATGCRDHLQREQERHRAECELAVERVADVAVADTQDVRDEPPEQADRHAAHRRLPPDGRPGERQEPPSHPEQELHEHDRDEPAGDAEDGVDRELQRVHQLIGRNVEQWFVAEHQVEDGPRGRRTDDDRPDHRGVQVAQYLFQGEEDRRDGRVECRGESRGRPDRDERAHAVRPEPKPTSEYGGDARADLDRRSFTPECDAAGERDRGTRELAQDRAQFDVAVVEEERGLGLRNAAATRVREVAGEQQTAEQRAGRGNGQPVPSGAARRVAGGRRGAR